MNKQELLSAISVVMQEQREVQEKLNQLYLRLFDLEKLVLRANIGSSDKEIENKGE